MHNSGRNGKREKEKKSEMKTVLQIFYCLHQIKFNVINSLTFNFSLYVKPIMKVFVRLDGDLWRSFTLAGAENFFIFT